MNMTILYWDAETLPCNDESVIAEIAKTITPPGNIKLADSIAKWHAENGAQALADAVAKTSFDGLFGRIACIAWAFDDGEIHCTSATETEVDAIKTFYAAIETAIEIDYRGGSTSTPLQLCGHNIAGFDLPFLKARSIILGIKPPPGLLRAMKAKPWDDCILDTMLMWSPERDMRVSMDKLCKALGISGKGDFDGSMVANEWENGSKEKVISYCCDDVERTRNIYNRLIWA